MKSGKKNILNILLVRMGDSIIKESEHPRHCCPPFTLKYIQAILTKDTKYRVELIDCMVESVSLQQLLSYTLNWLPDLLVICNDTFSREAALKYALSVKKAQNTFIIGIGQDVIARPEKYPYPNFPFDIILHGEVEKKVTSLIEKLNEDGGIENVKKYYFRKFKKKELILVEDLDSLPFPSYDLVEMEKYRFLYPIKMNKKVIWGHILSTRGCPHRCFFCSPITRYSYGEKVRTRKSANVVDEMENLMRQGVNIISFDDDDFTVSEKHIVSVCREIQRRNLKIRWITHARIDEVTESLMRIMKEAGCVLLRFGIESGSKRIIKILNKNDAGIDWSERCMEVFKAAKKVGISTDALLIIGNPGETKIEVEASMKLVKDLNPDMLQIHFFTPYPGSAAYDRFKEEIKDEKNMTIAKMYHYANPCLNLSSMRLDELLKIRSVFYRKILLRPSFFIRHLTNYLSFYFHNIDIFRDLSKVRKILFADYITNFYKFFKKTQKNVYRKRALL